MTTVVHPTEEVLLAFARAVRAAGVPVTADRERTYLTATCAVGLADPVGVFHAGRATLCSTPQDLHRHDQVYAAWFGGEIATERPRQAPPAVRAQADLTDREGEREGDQASDGDAVNAVASRTELLRHRDIAQMSQRERAQLARLFGALRVTPPTRRSHRHTHARRGRVDAATTLRQQLRRMGEPGPVRWTRRARAPRRVVLLIDVSGSMSAYADALLRLAHRIIAGGGPVEAFTLGTRLTHVTRALRLRDPEQALVAAGEVVPDWSGGTRLGDGLAAFLDRWGRRGMARGAVVVLFSDGWERDAPEHLGEQMRRLHGLAHRVIWVNPHRGKPGFEPVQIGMVAALPHIDDFLAGHTMATFAELTEVIADA